MPAIIFFKQNTPSYVAIIAEADHTLALETWAKGIAETHDYSRFSVVPAWDCVDTTQDLDERLAADHAVPPKAPAPTLNDLRQWFDGETICPPAFVGHGEALESWTFDAFAAVVQSQPIPAPDLSFYGPAKTTDKPAPAARADTKNSGRLGLTFASPESTQFQTGYIYKTIQEAREAAQKGLAVCWQLKGKVGPDLVAKALDTQVDSMTNPENHHDVFYAQIQDTETTLEEWGIDTDTGLPVCTDHGIDPETPLQGIREIARRNSWSKDALLQHIFNFLEEDKDAAERLLTYVVAKGL